MQFLNIEAELLICCLRTHLNIHDDSNHQLNLLLKKDIDWEYFFLITSSNRVIPLVWKSFKNNHYHNIPKTVANSLLDAYHKIAAHHALHINELKKILLLFKEHKLAVFPIKGAVLGQFYKHTPLREWSDLDIIIKKNDIGKVIPLLKSIGYFQLFRQPDLSFEKALENKHSFDFMREDHGVNIDVHWNLAEAKDEVFFPVEKIWKKYSHQSFYGIEIPMLDHNYLILSTCIHHGARNGWKELRYIFDMAIILHSQKDIHWKDIIETAEKAGIKRVLLVGVSLSHELFKVSIPSLIQCEMAEDKYMKVLVKNVFYELFKKREHRTFYLTSLKIQMRDKIITRSILYYPFIIKYIYYLIKIIKKHGFWYFINKIKEKWG